MCGYTVKELVELAIPFGMVIGIFAIVTVQAKTWWRDLRGKPRVRP
jgi:hypothetical protein